MISLPSDLPTFMRPIVLTRHEFQPSMNFLAPSRTLTEESLECTVPKRGAPNWSSLATKSDGYSSHSFMSLEASPTFTNPKESLLTSPACNAISPEDCLMSCTCSLPG